MNLKCFIPFKRALKSISFGPATLSTKTGDSSGSTALYTTDASLERFVPLKILNLLLFAKVFERLDDSLEGLVVFFEDCWLMATSSGLPAVSIVFSPKSSIVRPLALVNGSLCERKNNKYPYYSCFPVTYFTIDLDTLSCGGKEILKHNKRNIKGCREHRKKNTG